MIKGFGTSTCRSVWFAIVHSECAFSFLCLQQPCTYLNVNIQSAACPPQSSLQKATSFSLFFIGSSRKYDSIDDFQRGLSYLKFRFQQYSKYYTWWYIVLFIFPVLYLSWLEHWEILTSINLMSYYHLWFLFSEQLPPRILFFIL